MAKIKRAAASADQAQRAEIQHQIEQSTPAGRIRTRKPPPPAAAPSATKDWSPKRSRGRPRREYAKSRRDFHPVSEFCEAHLVPDPDCAEFIGTRRPIKSEGTGATMPVAYPRQTLIDAYVLFCREKGYPLALPRTFAGLILKACSEFGWPALPGRAGESRRHIIRGICLKNQAPFHGDDRGLLGEDRRRWRRAA